MYKYIQCQKSDLTKWENSVMNNILVCVVSFTIPEKMHKVINIDVASILILRFEY